MIEANHSPLRPMWICAADGHPWPCGPARLELAEEARRDRTSTCVYLGTELVRMILDLHSLDPDTAPEPAALASRVLGWLPPRSRT